MKIKLNTEKDIFKLVDAFIQMSKDVKTALLYGDLGAGKTTFVKELARRLGSVDATSSPTYSLINEYKISEGKLFHIDLYRLEYEVEALEIGIEDYLYSGEYCLVEWPQVVEKLVEDVVIMKFEVLEDNSRLVEIDIQKR